MPKHKKHFINRKTATHFALVQRSQQDKFAGDCEVPQNVLKDISRKKEQQKYGIFFEDDYDYLQHLRRPFNKQTDESQSGDETEEPEGKEEQTLDQEDTCNLPQSSCSPQFRIHEALMGFDDPMFDGRVLTSAEELDEDILEAMMKAEAGEEEEGEGLPDNFIHLASCAAPEEDEEESERLTSAQQAMMDHYFDTLGGEAVTSRLSEFQVGGEDSGDDDEEDVLQQLREHRIGMESRGEDYHSQCLGLQIEKLVEDAVSYDIDDIRSRLSGVSCALTESMKQAIETDKRLASLRLVKDPDCLMTKEEKEENIVRTLAIIEEDSHIEEEETGDPVQAWVNFDRRPRVTHNVDSNRVGYEPIDDVLASCTVHPAAVSLKKQQGRRREKSTTSTETHDEEKVEMGPLPERLKGETSEARRQRKAIVKMEQRQRRAFKKENKMTFKAETVRQRAVASSTTHVMHIL